MGYRNWARPLGLSDWSGGSGWWNWERPFTRWAESNGYRLDVAISQDLELHPEVLDGHRLVLSVGHDEYWSWGMRDALDAFVAAGGNAAIFSGNTCFWQVRFDEDHRGDDVLQVPRATRTRWSARPTSGSSPASGRTGGSAGPRPRRSG